MAIFCIPKHLITKLKESAIKGEVDVKKLYSMSSAERRKFFTDLTNDELGKFINTEFEKAMVSKQKTALTDWAKSVFTPKAQEKPQFKSMLDKIRNLGEMGVLTPQTEKAFLQDLVSDRLGITVTPEEIAIIDKRAKAIDLAQEHLGPNLGNPNFVKENLEFFKAKKAMDDYLISLNPSSRLKVVTGTIGRGMMLASVKSPLLNIASNIEAGFFEAITRRAATQALRGADNKLAIRYVKMVNKIYQATGYDLSRMQALSDTGASGRRVLDDTVHSQGPGYIRKAGRIMEDTVFKQLMGAPDVAFASSHFADSVNLNAASIAKNAKHAAIIMEDAMRITPQTPEGELLRAQAIMDAEVATWTNDGWASKISIGIRKLLNQATGDLRGGDYLMPFVKTPANVIETGLDYAGVGFIKAMAKTFKGIRTGTLGDKQTRDAIFRDVMRAGLGLTAAFLITLSLDDDDFVGAYDPDRKQIEALRNSNYNAIRIGNKWVSVDWLGPLSVSVSSIMYARKYGKNKSEAIFQYAKGGASQLERLPGVSTIADYFRNNETKNKTLKENLTEAGGYAAKEIFSRLVPSVISDVARGIDDKERKTSGVKEELQAKIPGVRESLPEKSNIFSEPIKTEGFLSTLLFGRRVTTSKETALIKELNRVSTANDKPLNFTDWEKSNSAQLIQFKEQVGGEEFKKARLRYGELLREKLESKINSSKYKDLSEAEKLKVINSADSEAQTQVFKEWNFKYKQKKSEKINL